VKTPVVYLSAMLLLVLLSTAGAVGDTLILSDRDRTSEEPAVYPVSLALSGGGARGLATIGILKAFEERNIRPVAIAGTSIGGIVGGLYAAGYSADDLRRHVGQFDFENLFSNRPERRTMFQTKRSEEGKRLFTVRFNGLRPAIPQGLTAGQRLTELLTRLTVTANYRSQGDFDRPGFGYATVAAEHLLDGFALDIFHCEIAVAVGRAAGVDSLHDVDVIEVACGTRLAVEALDERFVAGIARQQHLERNNSADA